MPKPVAGARAAKKTLSLRSMVLGAALLHVSLWSSMATAASSWPAWDKFEDHFVQADGRVIDVTFDQKSTSEGQSYGLFFALVANDRKNFDAILDWTSDNLADGQLGEQLPAWHWGKRPDQSWGVKDPNAASDADLWLAYTLLEAARLWQAPAYARQGRKLLAQIQRRETVDAGKSGTLLLPGPVGFAISGERYRINTSYIPGFMFRYLASVDPKGPWQAIWDSHLRLAPQLYAAGVAPDLAVVDRRGKLTQDTERAPSGSYDAIRVYMWAGMSGPDSTSILALLKPYVRLIDTYDMPPERVNPADGKATKHDFSPIGFSGAVLPFLHALGETELLKQQLARLDKARTPTGHGSSTNYYDESMILFGRGWLDGHYRFSSDGQLLPKWNPQGTARTPRLTHTRSDPHGPASWRGDERGFIRTHYLR